MKGAAAMYLEFNLQVRGEQSAFWENVHPFVLEVNFRPCAADGEFPGPCSPGWGCRWLLAVVLVMLSDVAAAGAPYWRPYRVLVVTGTQVLDDHAILGALDTGDVIGLLQLWGVPY